MTDTETIAETFNLVDSYKRRPLDEARRVAAIHDHDGMRAYLREHRSPYAGSPDPGLVQAAFLGHVQFVLESLARAYEHEVFGG